MDKYQRLFIKQMKEKIREMTRPGQFSTEAELYRLLHSVKGTAGTIGLDDWFQAASERIDQLDSEGERQWEAKEARELLAPLAYLLLAAGDDLEEEGTDDVADEQESAETELPAYLGTLLVVDDDLSLLQMLKDYLERLGYMVLATPDAGRALELFYSMKPDCVVLDIVLQGSNGLDLLQEMQARSEQYLIPIVMISASNNRETRIRAYESGADDFIGKPLDVEEFAVRVKRQISRRLKLNTLLMTDELTGAYNNTYFAQELVRHLQRLPERPEPSVLTLFDLDSFRYINERFGYTEGDRLLKHFSDLVKPSLGPLDIWARDRHDRFYLLQPGMSEKEAASFANQLLAKLEQEEHHAGSESYHISFSAGVLELKPGMTAPFCYDRILRIVAEAKRRHDGVIVVPERRALEHSPSLRLSDTVRQTQTAVPDDRPVYTAPTNSSNEAESVKPDRLAASAPSSPQDTAVTPSSQSDTGEHHPSPIIETEQKMDSLLSNLSSRLQKHANHEPLFSADSEDTRLSDTSSSSRHAAGDQRSAASAEDQPEVVQPVILPDNDLIHEPDLDEAAGSPAGEAPAPFHETGQERRSAVAAGSVVLPNETSVQSAPTFRADTIREAATTDTGTRRLEWVDRDEKLLQQNARAEVQHAPVPPVDIRSWRLAIIDDDDLIRNMLTKRLAGIQVDHRLDVRAFSDGEDFFSDGWHNEDTQYLLILDRMMPRMNGMEVLRRLRSSENRSRYTVLMLTGVGDDREVAEAISAGTDDYLTKPFSIVELEARIRRLLGRMRA
ncbi:response regulator [Paenibacillus kandeliae]|uniref:response regulator n=1 Tax=Paenibacillus kandeliae TaxID=3231269 RepID=UPI00345813FC